LLATILSLHEQGHDVKCQQAISQTLEPLLLLLLLLLLLFSRYPASA
jgi:hypothetical protein